MTIRTWEEGSPSPDATADLLSAVPQARVSHFGRPDFLIGEDPAGGPANINDLLGDKAWVDARMAASPPGVAIPPRPEETPVQVWNRMMGNSSRYANRIEIVDRYIFNGFRNARLGESALEQILSECLSTFSGELVIHCGRLEDLPFSYETAARRLRDALQPGGGKNPRSVRFRLCRGGPTGKGFPHDRWVYFGFVNGAGVMYSLGRGVDDIQGAFDVRSLAEHLAPGDWVKLDAKTQLLEDRVASEKLNQMLNEAG